MRPVLDQDGGETGMFDVPAGGRRYRALELLVKQKRLVGLDIAATGWSPTADNYLGRVTKARILQAVCEARGEQAAQLIDHLKKGEMAERAQELLAGSGWLPEPLRTPGRVIAAASPTREVELGSPVESSRETATTGYETAMADSERPAEGQPIATEPHAVAAE